ncbi:hypothetical protein [Streptomyces javensis]|nr:hypothetical protein [Streptomyces javensis]MBI0318037.1 hypothetical protein [Streptomyces javensis]
MHASNRATTPTREARVMAFLGSHDLVGIPAGEPNLTVRELLIAVHRVSVAHPVVPCAPPPSSAFTSRHVSPLAFRTAHRFTSHRT